MKGGRNPGKEAMERLTSRLYRLGLPRVVWQRQQGTHTPQADLVKKFVRGFRVMHENPPTGEPPEDAG